LLLESADAATVAASLIEWRRSVILVDAADMDLAPGEHRFFCDSDVSLILKSSSVSTHGFGLAEGLELARTLGYDQSVRILGIQPFDLSPRKGLTPEMTARFPYLLSALRAACTKPI
jgi:hydrogenase maturation protease